MAESIVDRTVINVQSPFLDQLDKGGRRRAKVYPYEVVTHCPLAAPTVHTRPLDVPHWADSRLVRMHILEDGGYRLLWTKNSTTPAGHLVLQGEGFEFTADRVGNAWALTLPADAPTDVAELIR